jgi:hypothetical protein
MDLTLRRWRARHLLAAWSAYWAGLAAVTLAPAARALARLTGPGEHGSAAASFDDGMLELTIASPGAPSWVGAVPVGELALWVAVPPLVLWLLWLLRRPRGGPAEVEPPARREPPLGAATAAPPPALPDAGLQPPVMGTRGSAPLASSPRPGREPGA